MRVGSLKLPSASYISLLINGGYQSSCEVVDGARHGIVSPPLSRGEGASGLPQVATFSDPAKKINVTFRWRQYEYLEPRSQTIWGVNMTPPHHMTCRVLISARNIL